jgi:hypothetical protein
MTPVNFDAVTRRDVLSTISTGAALAAAGVTAGLAASSREGMTNMSVAEALNDAAAPIAPAATDRGVLEAYCEWLMMEQRLASKELYGDYFANVIPANTGASHFHIPMFGSSPEQAAPPPSARAARVLAAVGLHVGGFPKNKWHRDLPLLQAIGRRAQALRILEATEGAIPDDHPAFDELANAESMLEGMSIHSLAGADAAARLILTAEEPISDAALHLLNELVCFLGSCVEMDDKAKELQAMTWQRATEVGR